MTVRLGNVLRLRKEVVHPHDKPTGQATFVGLEHLEVGTGRRTGSLQLDLSYLTGRKPRFHKEDIVYGYLRPYLNKVWVAEFDGLCSVDQYVYEVDRSVAEPDFVAWFMRSPSYLAKAPVAAGPGQLPRIRLEEVAAVEIKLPDLDRQRSILRLLTEQMATMERARAAAEAQLTTTNSLPGSYLRAVFESREAGRWLTKALAEISDIVGGIQKSPDRAPVRFHRPYLTVRNVQRGYLDQTRIERFETAPDEVARLRLLPGDILIVEGNGSLDHIGRNALFVGDGEEWIHQNHVIRVRIGESTARPEFVSRYLNCDAGRRQMVEKARTTSGLYVLGAGKVGSLEVPVPPLLEQDRVLAGLGQKVREAEQVRLAVAGQLGAVRQLPASLLRRAFGGEP